MSSLHFVLCAHQAIIMNPAERDNMCLDRGDWFPWSLLDSLIWKNCCLCYDGPYLLSFWLPDKRRMKIVEMGGAQELVNMLGSAKDDRTRKEALKALVAISKSGQTSLFCCAFRFWNDQAWGELHIFGRIEYEFFFWADIEFSLKKHAWVYKNTFPLYVQVWKKKCSYARSFLSVV